MILTKGKLKLTPYSLSLKINLRDYPIMHVKASYKNRIKLCILYSSLVEAIKELPAFYKGFFYFYFIAEGDWK